MRTLQLVPRRRVGSGAGATPPWAGMSILAAAVADAKINNPTVLSGITADTTATGIGVSISTYYDPISGNDSWDGTSGVFVSGTTGPKLTVPTTFNGSGTTKIAIVCGTVSQAATIFTDYSSGSVNQGIFTNQSDRSTVYIVGWHRALQAEITPAMVGFISLVDQLYNTGFLASKAYLNTFFFKMQGSNTAATSGTQGAAFNIATPTVIRNAWVDGHVMVGNTNNIGYTLEDCYMTNGGRASAGSGVVVGSVSGSTLTITSITSGNIYKGMYVVFSGAANVNTQISSQLTGSAWSTGTYQLNGSSLSAGAGTTITLTSVSTGWFARCEAELNGGSNTCTVSNGSNTLTVVNIGNTYLGVGSTLTVAGVPAGTKITGLLTGTGGNGSTYSMSANATSNQTGVALVASVPGMRIARCAAEPGAVGEDCIHQQPSNGPGPFGTVVTDCAFIHDCCQHQDASQHCDVVQCGRDPGALTIQRCLIQHTVRTSLQDYQGAGNETPVGSVLVFAAGSTTQSVDAWVIKNNILCSNRNIFNSSTNFSAVSGLTVQNNTLRMHRHAVYTDPLSSANIYCAGWNDTFTATYTQSNNKMVYDNSHFTPVTSNDGTHDCYISSGSANLGSGWTFATS